MSRATKQISAGLTTKSPAAEVTAVQDYLRRFGYLDAPDPGAFGAPDFPLGEGDDPAAIAGRPAGAKKGKLDSPTKAAIERFQAFANLGTRMLVHHGRTSRSSLRSVCRARVRRDFTVPMATPRE